MDYFNPILSHADFWLWLRCFGVIAVATGMTLAAAKAFPPLGFWLRKSLHVITISFCAYAIGSTQQYLDLLGWIFLCFGSIVVGVLWCGYLRVGSENSYGGGYFALSLGLLIVTGIIEQQYIAAAAWVLAIADPSAGVVGTLLGKTKWEPLLEPKSIPGSLAFAVSAMVVCYFVQPGLVDDWLLFVVLLILVTSSELFSAIGSDNLSIPLVVASLLMAVDKGQLYVGDAVFVLGIGVPILLLVYKRSWLTAAGSVAAGVLALVLSLALQWHFLLFPAIFLLVGSLLSRLPGSQDSDRKGRSSIQVFYNSFPAIIAALLFACTQQEVWSLLALMVFGAALTDTVSSEIGRRYGGPAMDILRWRRVPAGVSGGVSFIGTLAGIFAAFILPVIYSGLYFIDLRDFAMIVALSIGAMLLDSVIGSALQAKFMVDDRLSDKGNLLVRGYGWMTNDLVNLSSLSLAFLTGYFIL